MAQWQKEAACFYRAPNPAIILPGAKAVHFQCVGWVSVSVTQHLPLRCVGYGYRLTQPTPLLPISASSTNNPAKDWIIFPARYFAVSAHSNAESRLYPNPGPGYCMNIQRIPCRFDVLGYGYRLTQPTPTSPDFCFINK